MSKTVMEAVKPRMDILARDELMIKLAGHAGRSACLEMTWWVGTDDEIDRTQSGTITGVELHGRDAVPMLCMEESWVQEPDTSSPYRVGPGRWALPEKAEVFITEATTAITWSDSSQQCSRDFTLRIPAEIPLIPDDTAANV